MEDDPMQAIPLRKGVRPTLSPNMRERCPFPVICELLGLPLADRSSFIAWAQAIEDLAWSCSARGLSTRDIEAAFADAEGRRLVSRATVSEIMVVGGI